MKWFEFDCFPSQLYEWVRQYHRLPANMRIGDNEAKELTFTALFPNVRKYGTLFCEVRSCEEKDCRDDVERSVSIWRRQHSYYMGGSVDILTVKITDTDNGIEAALATIESAGLLNGQELIAKKLQEMRATSKAKEQAGASIMSYGIVAGIIVIVSLLVFIFTFTPSL